MIMVAEWILPRKLPQLSPSSDSTLSSLLNIVATISVRSSRWPWGHQSTPHAQCQVGIHPPCTQFAVWPRWRRVHREGKMVTIIWRRPERQPSIVVLVQKKKGMELWTDLNWMVVVLLLLLLMMRRYGWLSVLLILWRRPYKKCASVCPGKCRRRKKKHIFIATYRWKQFAFFSLLDVEEEDANLKPIRNKMRNTISFRNNCRFLSVSSR